MGQPCPLLENRGAAGRAEAGGSGGPLAVMQKRRRGGVTIKEEEKRRSEGRKVKRERSWEERRRKGKQRADGREGEGAGWGSPLRPSCPTRQLLGDRRDTGSLPLGSAGPREGKGKGPGPAPGRARAERRPVPDVERLVVLQPGDRELQGGVVLDPTLQLHGGAPFDNLVLRNPEDPGGVCGETQVLGADTLSAPHPSMDPV